MDGNKILKETDGTKTITYYYGNGGVIGFQYNGADYYFEKNLQGDITAIYNSSGQKQAEYIYDAWGNIIRIMDASGDNITDASHVGNVNPFRYRGYYYDVETGLYYLESRYYDPEVGRFLNADSLEYLGEGSDLQNHNLYAYCENNPVMGIDPAGTFLISAIIAGAIVGMAIGFGVTAYADYKDDGEVFNGSIGADDYVANTLVGGIIGGLTGGIASSTFTFTLPTISLVANAGIGTTSVVVGTVSATISGANVLVGLGLLGGLIMLFAKPNTGPIRYSDGTGIDPETGKEFEDAQKARDYYNSLSDPKEKAKWKKWMKGKKWRRSHLK